ncbi:IS66 family insertion sequence element accessory protein TnpB [Myxococcaceae bacterium GXIMD 01537]
MIQITPQMRVLVAIEAVDFRRGVDGLAQQCRAALAEDPFSGAVFVFRNRQRTSVKLLVHNGEVAPVPQRVSGFRYQAAARYFIS